MMKTKILRGAKPRDQFDLAIGSCGYESRGSHIFRDLKAKDLKCPIIILRFPENDILSDAKNQRFFEDLGSKFIHIDSGLLEEKLVTELKNTLFEGASIVVDISTMTRMHIGIILDSLERFIFSSGFSIRVEFNYAVAAYSPPPKDFGSVKFKGPVTPRFGGWRVDTNLPNSVVFGVGYEPDVCLGLIEDIEPKEVVVFIPESSDRRYDIALRSANDWIDSDLPGSKVFTYCIGDPIFLYESLMSYLIGTMNEFRPIIIPFGPKIFALISMLCGLSLRPNVGVWRVSSGDWSEPQDRVATGEVSGISVIFEPDPSRRNA